MLSSRKRRNLSSSSSRLIRDTACRAFTFCVVDDSTPIKTTLNYLQYIQQHVIQSLTNLEILKKKVFK